jgi:WD40 repeat protein
VWCLAALEGRLFAGENGGHVRVWDPATGACEGALTGHDSAVHALLAVGPRLVSGDGEGVVEVWRRSGEGAGGVLAAGMTGRGCERTVRMEGRVVNALAAWGELLMCCGMEDGRIRVWGLADGAREAELEGHTGVVLALFVDGDRLYSALSPPTHTHTHR